MLYSLYYDTGYRLGYTAILLAFQLIPSLLFGVSPIDTIHHLPDTLVVCIPLGFEWFGAQQSGEYVFGIHVAYSSLIYTTHQYILHRL